MLTETGDRAVNLFESVVGAGAVNGMSAANHEQVLEVADSMIPTHAAPRCAAAAIAVRFESRRIE